MASGFWSETDKPIRPGFYNRFKAAALARIQMGKRGIVAMPVKANWGPPKEIVRITSERDLIDNFGDDMNYTAYKLGRLALLGQPKELLLYRLVDGTEKPASLTIKGQAESESIDVIKLTTKYPTTRDFRISVSPNVVDENLFDIRLYEGARPVYEFSKLSGTAAEIVEAINNDQVNKWLVAENLIPENNNPVILNSMISEAMTGGNDGTADITVSDYIDVLAAFEARQINGLALDGVTDPAIHTSLKGWLERVRKAGKKVRVYLGGPADETIEEANNRSKNINYEGIVNVGNGGILDGIAYTPAETACYIMGLAEGQDMKECLCNQTTIFQDVTKHLTHEEIEETILAGTLILRYDDGAVVIEDDVNTLKRYGQDQNETWGYLRAIRFMDMVDEDTSITGNRQYVGKVLNGRTGQLAVLSALKQYFEILQTGQLIEDFVVEIDEDLQKNAANDEFYWRWEAKYINVMKKIFGTGYIK